MPGREGEGKGKGVLPGGTVYCVLDLIPKGFKGEFLGEVPGEDLNRILSSFSGVSFQGPGLH